MFYSVLFLNREGYEKLEAEEALASSYFNDLGLDGIFDSIIQPKEEFELEKYYYKSLQDIETISYRQEVMRELENVELRTIMTEFSNAVYVIRSNMNTVRKKLSSNDELSNNYLVRGRMLSYAEKYIKAVTQLQEKVSRTSMFSEGLSGFVRYINEYANSETYQNLTRSVHTLREEFSTIEYNMLITGGTIKVRKYEGEKDYSKNILATFEKFRQGDVKDYRHQLSEQPWADHVESTVLNLLSKLYKDTFDHLLNFCSEYIQFDDETVLQFSREIQFYTSWLDYIKPLKDCGLQFNYPRMEVSSKHLYGQDCFDLALAKKIQSETVTNDFSIQSPESILVVTGPNQGGKTTFAKMFGQMHYLASIGLSVPGKKSSLYIFDTIFTHFGREEDLSTHSGKLKDDLDRLLEITSKATNQSVIIINEIFSSTTLKDAISLGNHMIDRLIDLKSPTMIVTFIDELTLRGDAVVSMMSTVEKGNPTKRTYKIIRKNADGAAYAVHIASKHGLTYEKLCRRLKK